MKNCTLFIASCDKYYQAWEPFFFFLKKYWKNFAMPIILNTETKQFEYDGFDIKTFSFYKENEEVPWGKRMLDHLDKVETDYVLWVLEDFFLRRYVNEDELKELITILEQNSDISMFSLCNTALETCKKGKIGNYELRPRRGKYKFSTGGLWRVSHLKKYILPNESPWQWETEGNYRSAFTKNKFYMLGQGCPQPLDFGFRFDELGVVEWVGIRRGQWVINDVKPLFEANGIKVNYDELGVWEGSEVERRRKKLTLKKKISKITKEIDPVRAVKIARKYYRARKQIIDINDY